MKIEELIKFLVENGYPQAEVLIVDNNGLAWCLEEGDIKVEKVDDGWVVLLDSPNVNISAN